MQPLQLLLGAWGAGATTGTAANKLLLQGTRSDAVDRIMATSWEYVSTLALLMAVSQQGQKE